MKKYIVTILLLLGIVTVAYADNMTRAELLRNAAIAESNDDYKTATDYLERALSIQADGELLCLLGSWYSFGKNGMPNKDKALHYYNKAVEMQYPPSFALAGYQYYIKDNYDKASMLFMRAIYSGQPEGLWRYGIMQMLGQGMKPDVPKAVAKILVAMKHGEPDKQLRPLTERVLKTLNKREKAEVWEEIKYYETSINWDEEAKAY